MIVVFICSCLTFFCEKLNIDGLYNKKQAKRLNILPTKNCFISKYNIFITLAVKLAAHLF
jgi:hypothetical protein